MDWFCEKYKVKKLLRKLSYFLGILEVIVVIVDELVVEFNLFLMGYDRDKDSGKTQLFLCKFNPCCEKLKFTLTTPFTYQPNGKRRGSK